MNRNRFAQNMIAAAMLVLLCGVPGAARGDSPQNHPAPTPNPALPGPPKLSAGEDDFAGLDLSEDQKSEITKIRQDTVAHRAAVEKSTTLNQDQKDAMLQGYIRLEYSQIFRTLTPLQQKVVRQRIQAHKAEAAKQNGRASAK